MGVRYRNDRRRLDRLRCELAQIVPQLIDEQTEKVIVFGSTARGEVGSISDLDVLLVRRDARRPSERVDELYRRVRPQIALDLLVYTPEELIASMAESSFLRNVLREGQVLYERSRTMA